MTMRLAGLILLAACARAKAPAPPVVAPVAATLAEVAPAVALPAPVSPPAAVSVTVTSEPGVSPYDLALTLTDDAGKPRQLDVGRGHVTLLALFYASCPSACPALIERLRKGLQGLTPAQRQDVRVVLITFDPEQDSVQALHAVRARHALDPQWALLRPADGEAVRDVAAALDIAYRRLPDGEFEHDSVVVVLDAAGKPVARIDSLALNKESVGAAVAKASGR